MAETRPPAELARHSFHWLRQRDLLPQVWEWVNHGWLRTGDGFRVTPEAMHERGWRYDKPCLYDAAPLAEAERAVVAAAKTARRAALACSKGTGTIHQQHAAEGDLATATDALLALSAPPHALQPVLDALREQCREFDLVHGEAAPGEPFGIAATSSRARNWARLRAAIPLVEAAIAKDTP